MNWYLIFKLLTGTVVVMPMEGESLCKMIAGSARPSIEWAKCEHMTPEDMWQFVEKQ